MKSFSISLLLFSFIFLGGIQEDAKVSLSDGYRQQYEGRRKKWEDDRCINTCGGFVYLPLCCFGCFFWRYCRRDYCQLRKDALELRQKNIEVDNPACPACCGWCAPLCFRENKIVPLESVGK